VHPEAEYIVDKLNLIKLDGEGGYYRETYRSDHHLTIKSDNNKDWNDDFYRCSNLENKSSNVRSIFTSIYYLLDGEQFSAFHKVKYDEIWHFYKGSSVNLHILTNYGKIIDIQIGNNLENDEKIQYVIKGDTWFSAEINDKSSYSLIGCSVSPGFDFKDFELGERNKLKNTYPHQEYIINRLTRK
jgi:uncharacterized protein